MRGARGAGEAAPLMRGLYLVAQLGGRTVAIASDQARSVAEIREITPVPRVAGAVLGLAAQGGWVATVVDTARAIGLPCSSAATGCAAVVTVEGHDYALLVDSVRATVALEVRPPAADDVLSPLWRRVAIGLAADAAERILILRPAAILIAVGRCA